MSPDQSTEFCCSSSRDDQHAHGQGEKGRGLLKVEILDSEFRILNLYMPVLFRYLIRQAIKACNIRLSRQLRSKDISRWAQTTHQRIFPLITAEPCSLFPIPSFIRQNSDVPGPFEFLG